MQAQLKIKFALARLPSKNFIYFKPCKNANYGVHGELPIIHYDITVEKPRPNIKELRLAPFAKSSKKVPMLTFNAPTLVFERVIC